MNFIPDTATLIPFTLAVMVITITPGPDMTLFVGRAISQGRAAGLACLFGAVSGLVVHTVLVAAGLSALLVASPQAFLALKIAGAGYLLWLAWQAIRHGSAFSPDMKGGRQRSLLTNWATGLGINLMNPKIILFFMTFLPQFVSPGDAYAPHKLFFLGMSFIVLSLPVTVAIVLAADGVAGFLRGAPKVMRAIDYLFAGVFSAFAFRILTAQAR